MHPTFLVLRVLTCHTALSFQFTVALQVCTSFQVTTSFHVFQHGLFKVIVIAPCSLQGAGRTRIPRSAPTLAALAFGWQPNDAYILGIQLRLGRWSSG